MKPAPSREPREIIRTGHSNDANSAGSSTAPVIELRGISKSFGPVEVLSNVDLSLYAGRVHSLAGENGAGKSTLVKILGGIYQPDNGLILKNGVETAILGSAGARRQGIAVIHQHPATFPDLSVAENIFVGRQPRRMGGIDWSAMTDHARQLLASLRMEIDVSVPVKILSIAERQAIEIAKALSIDARVLVMDEPTSTISSREVDRLFEIVGQLKKQGVAILFISHFLDEILGRGDEVTVLRSGKVIVTLPAAELTPAQIVRHMIGTEPGAFFPKEKTEIGMPVLSVRGLSGAGFVEDVSFEVRAGEILGFFGLVGAGRSEVRVSGASVLGTVEVLCVQRQILVREPLGSLKVQFPATRPKQRGVGSLLDQRMSEQEIIALRQDQGIADEAVTGVVRTADEMPQQRKVKTLADNRRSLERLPVALRQPIHARKH